MDLAALDGFADSADSSLVVVVSAAALIVASDAVSAAGNFELPRKLA